MKIIYAILFSLCTQAAVANGNPTGPATCQLAGQVIESGTAEELTGVKVTISGTEIFTYSDRSGHFEFPAVPAGPIVIEFSLVSFEPGQVSVNAQAGSQTELTVSLESR